MPQPVSFVFRRLRFAALACLAAIAAGYTLAAAAVSWLTSLAPAARPFPEAFPDLWWAAMIWAALTACIAIAVRTWPVSRVGYGRAVLLYGAILLGASWVVNAHFMLPHWIAGTVSLAELPGRIHASSLAHLPFNTVAAAALVATFHWIGALQRAPRAPARAAAAQSDLVVIAGRRTFTVPVATIEWIESADDYAILHCGTASHICNERLYRLEARLASSGFLRVHRSALVNVTHISALAAGNSGELSVELASGSRVRASRRRRRQVRQAILARDQHLPE